PLVARTDAPRPHLLRHASAGGALTLLPPPLRPLLVPRYTRSGTHVPVHVGARTPHPKELRHPWSACPTNDRLRPPAPASCETCTGGQRLRCTGARAAASATDEAPVLAHTSQKTRVRTRRTGRKCDLRGRRVPVIACCDH